MYVWKHWKPSATRVDNNIKMDVINHRVLPQLVITNDYLDKYKKRLLILTNRKKTRLKLNCNCEYALIYTLDRQLTTKSNMLYIS